MYVYELGLGGKTARKRMNECQLENLHDYAKILVFANKEVE